MSPLIHTPNFSPTNALTGILASTEAYAGPPTIRNEKTETEVIIRDLGTAIIIAYKGTSNLKDFVTDAKAWRKHIKDSSIHIGFLQAHLSVILEVLSHVASMNGARDYQIKPGKPIFVFGHSLGGALAILCADQLERQGFRVQSVYTYGQPRVGDTQFCRDYNSRLGDRTYRFVHEEDIIPRILPVLLGYRHCGTEIFAPAYVHPHKDPAWIIAPPLTLKLTSDAIGFIQELRHGRLALLNDHHISGYEQAIRERRMTQHVPEGTTAHTLRRAHRALRPRTTSPASI